MNIKLQGSACGEIETVVIPVFEDKDLNYVCEDIRSLIDTFKNKGQFKGGFGETFFFTKERGEVLKQIILLGLGKQGELTSDKIRIAYSKALRKVNELKASTVAVKFFKVDSVCTKRTLKGIVEGLTLANYKFDKFKSDRKEATLKEIVIKGIAEEDMSKAEIALEEANTLVDGTIIARDLVNEPANFMYPETLAKEVEKIGKDSGFQVEIFDENKINELGMKAFMEVAKGSDNPPRFIVMRYFGDEDNKNNILGLVGKGLTYDSGGYSIKPTDGMVTMKSDMGGAAAVIGAMSAIAKMKIKANVVAVVAACENLISGGAYKPGDIISSMGGKTIEVLNTDAEGRLTLVDAVHYVIEKEKASKVVDVATLTGAVVMALGRTATGVVTNNHEFYGELQKASEISGEKIWELPAFDEYKELIKSDIADLKNIGGRFGGTITAGLFIGEFVQDKPWLHLDIAGTAWEDKDNNYLTKGGTGVGVRTLYYLVKKSVKGCCNK
ncbi:leucyl aminopeptidase [Clostridium sp.]|uniref:leucyl aminopeptidase n=1 Tax=Clostridium sp. TaxID=1506 RepID=UPI003464B219